MNLRTTLALATVGVIGLGGGGAALASSAAGAATPAPVTSVAPTQPSSASPAAGDEKASPETDTKAETEQPGAEAGAPDARGQDGNHQCPPSCDTAHGEQQ